MDMEVVSPGKPEKKESVDTKTLISFHSTQLWNRLISIFPSSHSNFLGKISSLYLQITRARLRKRRPFLPLPLTSKSIESPEFMNEASRIFDALEDILEHVFLDLHKIQKNLLFWQSRAQGSNYKKMYFMIFERGPQAFVMGTAELLRNIVVEGSSMQHLSYEASAYVSERITVLTHLRYALASFLAQVYMEVDRAGEELIRNPGASLPSLLVAMNDLFLKLEASISELHAVCKSDPCVDESYSCALQFEKLPEVNQESSQWTDCESKDAINLIYQNLQKLDCYLSFMVVKYQKPRKATLYWKRYTCGVVGLSICSMWVLRHSSLMGSPDIENWVREAKESTLSFWNDHVEQPLLSIRNELFETFRKRDKGVMELEEVQLTAHSLHRMLLTFSKQTKGEEVPENTPDQEMLEIVMARYEKELMHPIQNLLNGELARALLIQVQKLKLDIETAMLELDQILRANEINFAILAALPAFFLSLILLAVARAWYKKDTRAVGKGRIARLQRRLLVVEVERSIIQYQIYMDTGLEKDAQFTYGLVLYSLDRLYRAVKWHAETTGEWECLKQDIIDLGKPTLQTGYKLTLTSRLERVYDCLLPSYPRK